MICRTILMKAMTQLIPFMALYFLSFLLYYRNQVKNGELIKFAIFLVLASMFSLIHFFIEMLSEGCNIVINLPSKNHCNGLFMFELLVHIAIVSTYVIFRTCETQCLDIGW